MSVEEGAASATPAAGAKKKRGLKVPRGLDTAFFIAGLGLLAYVVSRYPFDEISRAVSSMWPLVLVTPLIALSWFACGTSTLYMLLDRRVPWLDLLWIRLVGDAYNALLPLGGFGGEPFKLRQLTFHVTPATAMAALIRDRVVDNAVGFLVSAATVGFGLARYHLVESLRIGLTGYVVVVSVIGVAAWALVLTRLPGRIGGWLARLVGGTAPEKIDTLPASRALRVAAWCFGARTLGLLEIWTLLSILGLHPDLVTVGFVDGFLNAAGYVGFPVPGGVGVLEGAAVYVFGVLGAPGALAVAFAFARRGRMLAVGLFGVALHVVHLARRALSPGSWPEATAVRDARYRRDEWVERESARALPRLKEVARYVGQVEKPRVLQLGCGPGGLLPLLRAAPLATYVGTDPSAEAVRRASAQGADDARFQVQGFEQSVPEGRFDVVIFDDSLHQAQRPIEVLERHADALDPGGVLVVSLRHARRSAAIWKALRPGFETLQSSTVTGGEGLSWTVSVLRPIAATDGVRAHS